MHSLSLQCVLLIHNCTWTKKNEKERILSLRMWIVAITVVIESLIQTDVPEEQLIYSQTTGNGLGLLRKF